MADKTRDLKNHTKTQAKRPTYTEMVQNALTNLKQTRGSAKQTILNYICNKYTIGDKVTAKRCLDTALNTGVKNGSIKQIKGRGAYAVFKLGEKTKATVRKACKQREKVQKNKKVKPPITKTSKQTATVQKRIGKGSKARKSCKKSTSFPRQRSVKKGTNHDEEKTVKDSVAEEAEKGNEEASLTNQTTKRKAFEQNSLKLTDISITRNDPLCIRLFDDETDCGVKGLDNTPDGRLLVSDYKNKKIKMFDQEGKFLDSHLFPSLFFDQILISVVNNEEAILHISQMGVQVLHILNIEGNRLSIKEELHLKMKGLVISMSACQDNIVVVQSGIHGISVNLMNRRGEVLWSRIGCHEGQILFSLPQFCTWFLENDKPFIIVMDSTKNTMTKLDGETGDILDVHNDDNSPFGVSVDSSRGILYVCNRNNREVIAWTADLGSHRKLITHIDGLCLLPRCITFNSASSQVLISSDVLKKDSNYLDRYQIMYN